MPNATVRIVTSWKPGTSSGADRQQAKSECSQRKREAVIETASRQNPSLVGYGTGQGMDSDAKMERVNMAKSVAPGGKKPLVEKKDDPKANDKSGSGSTNGSGSDDEESDTSAKDGGKPRSDANEAATEQEGGQRRQTGMDSGIVKVEDAHATNEDAELQVIVPMVRQIFSSLDKMRHLETGESRWLFDKCQTLETQLKKLVTQQKIDLGGTLRRDVTALKATVDNRLARIEGNLMALNKTSQWSVARIMEIYEQMGWRMPVVSGAPSETSDIDSTMSRTHGNEDGLGNPNEDDQGEQVRRGVGVLTEDAEGAARYDNAGGEVVIDDESGENGQSRAGQTQAQSSGRDGQIEQVTSMTHAGAVACKDYFTGNEDEDIDMFLRRFDVWFTSNELAESKKGARLLMQLKGQAAEMVMDLEGQDYTDYQKIRECLLINFRKGKTDQLLAKSAIEKLTYQGCGSFAKFIMELTRLVKKVYPNKKGADLDERIFETAMRLLPTSFVIAMNRQNVQNLTDLRTEGPKEEANIRLADSDRPKFRPNQEAVRIATEMEGEESNMAFGSGQNRQMIPRIGGPIMQQQQRGQGNDSMQVQRSVSDRQIVCFRCRKPGHYAVNCRQIPQAQQQPGIARGQSMRLQPQTFNPQQQRGGRMGARQGNRQGVQCYNCQNMGHFAHECWSKRGGQPPVNPRPQRNRGGGRDQGTARALENATRSMNRVVDALMGPFANMQMGQGGYMQQPQYQQPQYQYGAQQPPQLQGQANMAIQYQPSVSGQSQVQQQQPQQPGQGRANQVNMMTDSVPSMINTLEGAKDGEKPVTMEDHKQLERMFKYVSEKMYQKDQELHPNPDLLATIEQHKEGLLPALIPVEKRLAVFPVKVNGVSMQALYDTGASITIASRTVADLAGIDLTENDVQVKSATGHIATMTQKGTARLTIANHTRDVEINFASDDQIGTTSPYDLIIGIGSLIEFPPITLDAKGRKLKIYDNVGMEIDLRTKGELLREERKVFAIEDKIIPARAGAVIAVLIDSSLGPNEDTMTVKSCGKEAEYAECLLSVDKDNRSALWILNESEEPIRIRKRTTIGTALNVIGEETCLTNYPEITMAVIQAASKINEVDPTYKVDYEGCDITNEQVEKLKKLVNKYEEQFSKNGYDLGLAKVAPMTIKTTTEIPFKPSIYPIPKNAKSDLQGQIDMMIQSGCIEESDTPWVSPIVMVKKKNGELRPCIDLRKLNELTIPDHFPLPRLTDALDRVAGKALLTGLDLNKGYQQLELDEEASRKCGIITPWGVYQCRTMPFGLRNAPSAFMRMMTKIMEGLEDICVVYMDDFIVMTEKDDVDQHLKDIERVLLRFKQYNIKANPKKCEFARRKITFLGHRVSKDGIEPDERNLIKIKDFPVPKNRKEVKRFLGMCSFFRRFIRRYAQIAGPLTELTRKDLEWAWKDSHQEAFEELRKLLGSKPILAFPDETKDYHLFVDASNNALGIALMQEKDGNEAGKPIDYQHISFYSRQFSQSERKWPIVQKELVSIIEGLRWCKYYTYGRKVIVHTDHRPLIHLIKKKATHPNLARWLIELQQYGDDTLQIQYIEGERNTVADALSRLETAMDGMNENELEDLIKGPFCLDVDEHREKIGAIHQSMAVRESFSPGSDLLTFILRGDKTTQELQREDSQLSQAIEHIEKGLGTEIANDEVKWYVEHGELDDQGVLRYKKPAKNGQKPLMVPEALRKELFEQFHTLKTGGGHSGIERTLSKMWRYAWRGKHKDLSVWHKECHDCQIRAPKRHKVPLVMTELDQVFERMGVDCCGPLFTTSKGNNHYVVAIDMFSKWLVTIAVPDTKALTVAKALYDNVILTFGCPKEIVSDNAKTFTAGAFEQIMEMLGIRKLRCTPYHHDGNAITERPIRDCSNAIAKYLAQAERDGVQLEWDDLVKEVAFCHNVTTHSTIGMSPFNLMFGREPMFPADHLLQVRKLPREDPGLKKFRETLIRTMEGARQTAAQNMRDTMAEAKRQADRHAKISDIQVGELVLYRDYRKRVGMSEKFKNQWLTVHRVKAIEGQHAWIVPRDDISAEPRRVHLNQIKRYYSEEERLNEPKECKLLKAQEAKKVKETTRPRKEKPIRNQEAEIIERRTAGGMKLRTFVRDSDGQVRVKKD